jgi:NAD(P)-dependent dehydrogenase (short-subunit alcohol dehydrogenase family)
MSVLLVYLLPQAYYDISIFLFIPTGGRYRYGRLTRETVGGTSGIGETAAREFVRHTLAPRVYLIGRSEAQASRIISELSKLNPDGKVSFIKSDISLLRGVDKACDEIKGKESRVNLLFLSAGILTSKGRDGMTCPVLPYSYSC